MSRAPTALPTTTPIIHTYTVEHLDPELGPWSSLEYQAIAKECHEGNAKFCLSSISEALEIPSELCNVEGLLIEHRSVEDIHARDKDRVCLLDPAAKEELSPEDGNKFDVFLFGGILGDNPPRGRLSTSPDMFLGLMVVR